MVSEDKVEQELNVDENLEGCNDTIDEKTEEEKIKDDKLEVKEDEKISKLNDKINELNDIILRNMAEFDNYRKRTDKEKSSMFDLGSKSVVEKLLPIIDNFERGLLLTPSNDETKTFLEGMDMIYKQMMKNLKDLGVEPIECIGKEFDPNLHNAVMHIEDENFGDNIICEELQKGYMFKDTVLRYSMVKVAN